MAGLQLARREWFRYRLHAGSVKDSDRMAHAWHTMVNSAAMMEPMTAARREANHALRCIGPQARTFVGPD